MPWMKERLGHECPTPIFWRFRKIGSKWQCEWCDQIWKVCGSPGHGKTFEKVAPSIKRQPRTWEGE